MAGALGGEMIASYQVTIGGFPKVRSDLKRLDDAIASLRMANYSTGVSSHRTVTSATAGGSSGYVLVTKLDAMEGRVKSAAQKAMAKSMALGRRTQSVALRAAVTPTGASGRPAGRNGPGRDVSSHMINSIKTNVETMSGGGAHMVTGWHGWQDGGESYFTFQEQGTRGNGGRRPAPRKIGAKYAPQRKIRSGGGIKPANSLGSSIIVVREHLKAELGSMK